MPHSFHTRALYLQVRDAMIEKIRSGQWLGGTQIPNETMLATEFEVSQGTIRKALDELVREQMVERKQGRGTLIKSHDAEMLAGRFYRLRDFPGFPVTRSEVIEIGLARDIERERLDLHPSHNVIRINRVRTVGDKPVLNEKIVISERLVPELAREDTIPGFLYLYYFQKRGIVITRISERVVAINADAGDARDLEVEIGQALLKLDCTGYDSNDRPIEWRERTCALRGGYYLSEVR